MKRPWWRCTALQSNIDNLSGMRRTQGLAGCTQAVAERDHGRNSRKEARHATRNRESYAAARARGRRRERRELEVVLTKTAHARHATPVVRGSYSRARELARQGSGIGAYGRRG